jgi:acetyl-CoA carboxylase beta subunit
MDRSTAEIQREWVRKYQDVERNCPHCAELVNLNEVLDNKETCPKCGRYARYCLGLRGEQWLEGKRHE